MRKQISSYTIRNAFLALLVAGVCITNLALVLPQDNAPKSTGEKVVSQDSKEVSGAKLFHYYCASCHGTEGKGDGPAAASLKTQPADLTHLAQKNGDKFPADHVLYILSNEGQASVHGSKDMPVWGPIFRKVGGGDQNIGRLRSHNLTDYIKSIQAK